jgi:hypothetical protein
MMPSQTRIDAADRTLIAPYHTGRVAASQGGRD